MGEKPKSKKWLIVIIVILIVAILSVGGYFVYQKYFNKQNTNQRIKDDTKNEIEQEIKLDTNSELVKDLYKLFHGEPSSLVMEQIFYTDKLVKEEDVSDYAKIHFGYYYLTEKDYTIEEFAQTGFVANTESYDPRPLECNTNDFVILENWGEWNKDAGYDERYNDISKGLCYAKVIPRENIKSSIEKLFGKNSFSEGVYESEYFVNDLKCEVGGKNFYCYSAVFGHGRAFGYEYAIKEAIQKEQEIYIYDYAMRCDAADGNSTVCYDANEQEILSKASSEEITDAETIERAPLYKSTFKQNADGTYYWYSSEPVKE